MAQLNTSLPNTSNLKRLNNSDIHAAQPAAENALEELSWWERNQFKLCILNEEPELPPNIPELKGLLDYFRQSKDHYAIAQRIGQLKRFVKSMNG